MLVKKKSYFNILMLLRVIGWLLIIECFFMIFPLITSFIYDEQEILDFSLSIGITGISGIVMVMLRPKSKDMGKREAIGLTGLTWVILSLFGMLPFLFCKTHISIIDAFFETMSGFTTTGASVLNTLEGIPKSILLWRCIIQWIGGLGIILFTLAVIPMLNYQGGMQLFNAEVTGITHDKLRPRVSSTAKDLWYIYISLTAILIFLLCFSDMDIFDAICHGLSTMSTGGFSTKDMSIEAWNSIYIKVVMIIFMFLGGVNFSLMFKAITGQTDAFRKNIVFKYYVSIILISYLLLTVNIFFQNVHQDWKDFTIDPLFQAVSIVSSTGLTEPDFHDWGPISVIILIILMFMGACAGSTSGGAKIDRFIVLIKFLKNEFYKVMHPNAVTTVSMNGKGMSYILVQKVLGFLFLYIIVIIIGGSLLTLTGLPLKDSFFCSLSAISNTGLGTDITGFAGNYSAVSGFAKIVLAIVMLIGRLELYTVLLLFTPTFWKR